MRVPQLLRARAGLGFAVALGLAVSFSLIAWVAGDNHYPVAAAQDPARLESTIFSYDGKDFVRTKTTLVTEDGKSAVNTKLDHATPAYKALVKKHSYVGDATVFGRKYVAEYAPLISDDGKLTGALFVAVAQ
jgi:hypothetical protein